MVRSVEVDENGARRQDAEERPAGRCSAVESRPIGRATPKPAQMPTCGDMEALAVEPSATKLPWLNRKLDRRTHVRTN
jgi:hypothetical protein